MEMELPKRSCLFIVFCLLITSTKQQSWVTKEGEGVVETLKNGMHMAGKFLSFDTASNVAQLISDAFKNNNNNNNKDDKPKNEAGGLVARILKLLSLDKTKIGAIVVNAIIFLAQLVSTSLRTKNPALPATAERLRKLTNSSPLDWILENKSNKLNRLMAAAEDENLMEKVLETIRSKEEDTSCVQQLVCRIAPIVNGMQRALSDAKGGGKPNTTDGPKTNALFRYLPEMQEFKTLGEQCRTQFQDCKLSD